jgi:mono/diheme cytochrome c family protein
MSSHNTISRRLALGAGAMGILAALALGGCSDNGTDPVPDGGGGDGTTVSFATDVQPIFNANCVGCHGANGGLDLSAGNSYGNLVGVISPNYGTARVVAGDGGASLLLRKMRGEAGLGNVMPPSGSLPNDTLDVVERWIDEGAEDN